MERSCWQLLRRTVALSNMRLKSHHMHQSCPSEYLRHNPQSMGQNSFKSQLSSITGKQLMDQKRPKPHRFKPCLIFCLKDRVRMEQRSNTTEGQADTTENKLRELALKWFTDTQAPLILHEGNFPDWFQGFISRKDAEDHLRDKEVGCFLIRLSDKATGYILSYRGRDRCRHFVINQNKEGQFIVTGDTEMHDTLTSLIEYYKTCPIEPFGEYLTVSCFELSSNDLYDVVQFVPKEKPGGNVKTVRNVWSQPIEQPTAHPHQIPALPQNSPRNSHAAQALPPVPKRASPKKTSSLEDKCSSEGKILYAQLDQERLKDRPKSPVENRECEPRPSWTGHEVAPRVTGMQQVRLQQRGPAPGMCTGTIYSELNLSDCRSKSLPLLDDNTKEGQSYRLSTPAPSPPQHSPHLQRDHVKKPISHQVLHSHSHSLDKLCDNSVYQLAGQPGLTRDTKQLTAKKNIDVTYAVVPRELVPNRFLTENTYEQIPEPRAPPSPEGPSAHGNTYETLKDLKRKPNDSSWGIKGDKWKWLIPENWKK